MINESFDDDVRVFHEFAVGLVFVVKEGSPVHESLGGWKRSHFKDVGGEEVEFLGSDKFILHGFLDSKVELDTCDDSTGE